MVASYGMSEVLGPITFSKEGSTFLETETSNYSKNSYSEQTAKEIDEEVKKTVKQVYQKVKQILEDKKDTLEKVSHLLLKKEVIEGEELREILK